jgi:hypothetical protein
VSIPAAASDAAQTRPLGGHHVGQDGDEIAAIRNRHEKARHTIRAAWAAYEAALDDSEAALDEWQRLDAVAVPLRDWLCNYFNRPGIIFRRPARLTDVVKRSHRPKAEVVPVLAQLVAEGLVRQVGSGYLPAEVAS